MDGRRSLRRLLSSSTTCEDLKNIILRYPAGQDLPVASLYVSEITNLTETSTEISEECKGELSIDYTGNTYFFSDSKFSFVG